MSTTKTKEELVRLSWLTELRRQGDRQCEGAYYDDDGNVCALGLLREVAGDLDDESDPDAIAAAAGLNAFQSAQVVWMNDGCNGVPTATFAEIADVVASWFPNG